jgi:putative ubiquitin-RnfH superfamily antitoxin RatB of RatAB toxin-antitoxin module
MKIEIVYALKHQQFFYTEKVKENTTIESALKNSQLLKDFPNLDVSNIGIFSRAVKKNEILQENDRIEIYRPLKIDPKEKRRERAKKSSG